MKTLKKGFASRVLSLMLVAIMVISLGTVGITSASAAEVDTAQTGWDANANIYCFNTKDDIWNVNSTVKMDWDNDGFHQYKISEVPTTDYLYFRLYDGYNYIAASEKDYQIYPGYETDYACSSDVQTQDSDRNWKIDMRAFSEKGDMVDVYVKFYNSYYINNKTIYNAMALWITGAKNNVVDTFTNKTVYFKPNSNWTSAGATFKVKTTGDSNGEKTYTLTAVSGEDGIYSVTLPISDNGNTQLQFLRMNQSGEGEWNSTEPTPYPTDGNDMYTITATTSDWSEVTFSWSKYTPTFNLNVSAKISGTQATETEVFAGTSVDITASTNAGSATVTYTLKDSNSITVGGPNTTGLFTVATTELSAGTYTYTVYASATIAGKPYTAESEEIIIEVKAFTGFTITPTFPTAVEFSENINITVEADTDYEVTYILKDSTGTVIGTNTQGVFSVATTAQDKDKTLSFTVEAFTVVNNQTHYATPAEFSVKVNPISNTTTVNIYFKSTSTLGFAPIATVTGVYETLTDVKMTPARYIGSNKTDTADYWWYKITTTVSVANPNISFSVKSSRYDMEATAYLTVVEDVTDYYFGIDNLYYTSDTNNIVNLTNDEHKDFFQSAVHMVYDPAYDSPQTPAEVSASYVLVDIGDVNCDGVVNIKDATAIQKSLANLTTLSKAGNKVSDFDGDNAVTIKDATAIQKMLVASL